MHARLPAIAIEEAIFVRFRDFLSDLLALGSIYRELSVPELRLVVAAGQHTTEQLDTSRQQSMLGLAQNVIARVEVFDEELSLELNTAGIEPPPALWQLAAEPAGAQRERP